ncbi:hypothetical protein BHG07_17550 [Brenneria salicis ATCC 15712 = DSM 30166]|nr:hypothetical protein BHG07_17550 [Brenneria salicis ATCC 15712 = DSM 30166]
MVLFILSDDDKFINSIEKVKSADPDFVLRNNLYFVIDLEIANIIIFLRITAAISVFLYKHLRVRKKLNVFNFFFFKIFQLMHMDFFIKFMPVSFS